MACVLQIGAGGVGGVVAHKMAMNREVFSKIILASRTLSKCEAIADSIRSKGLGEIICESVDADNVDSIVALIEKYQPKLVVNVALPYQDLAIMEACLRTKTHYLDTANYEHPDNAHFEYKEQWAYDTRYKEAGIFALLGSGFDPGVTNVFCAYAQKHYFDEIESIDILDCNAGDHGYAFATNFNPEINLREVSSKARFWVKDENLSLNSDLKKDTIYRKFEREERHWEAEVAKKESARAEASLGDFSSYQGGGEGSLANLNEQATSADSAKITREATRLKNESYFGGEWRDVAPLDLMKEWEYPEVGVKNSYLLYHEELESLIRNIRGLKRIRFFMTFGESYLTHMKCLENIGFLRVDEIEHNGQKIVPIQVLKTLLPDPASLAPRTKGQTHIGCYIKGKKDGKERTIYIYNICDHEKCFEEVNAQGVSYTTGVPAMIGAKLIVEGKWGINTPKNVSFVQSLQELDKSSINRQDTLSQSDLSTQPTNLTQNIHSCNTLSDSSIEAFNKTRLEQNKDMPKGGEYQGIDNGAELYAQNNGKNSTQAVEMRNCSFQGVNAGSYQKGNDQMSDAESVIYRSNVPCGGVWNMEQNDPDPFMAELNKQGLPYVVCEIDSNGEKKVLEDGRNNE
ncbi:saccharopine dehydrogenase [Helicobacter valdiviensis]|uniref:Saccharopine dehydrogenase n=1 Tax=Helicobacter valdiviensis TaxID=1458358 RepID=A0A2W6MZX8_9HELI|nr:saccharopine dehydrogenase family protein [Helicobacter valdiviensis]PZT48968.1 saccharopine dehydrogenase [Helicobacter valdiviensis]